MASEVKLYHNPRCSKSRMALDFLKNNNVEFDVIEYMKDPLSKNELKDTLRKLGSKLQGHPARDKGLPGIEVSTGSLGHGLSIANGLALASRLNSADYRVYCILGDGEIQEGQVWEAAMTAAKYHVIA